MPRRTNRTYVVVIAALLLATVAAVAGPLGTFAFATPAYDVVSAQTIPTLQCTSVGGMVPVAEYEWNRGAPPAANQPVSLGHGISLTGDGGNHRITSWSFPKGSVSRVLVHGESGMNVYRVAVAPPYLAYEGEPITHVTFCGPSGG